MLRRPSRATWLILVGLFVLGIVALSPTLREEVSWVRAASGASVEDYSRHIAAWPEGRQTSEAKRLHETALWADAVRLHTEESMLGYLCQTHLGKHAAEVTRRIEIIHWQATVRGGTIRHFQEYLTLYPGGQFSSDAERRTKVLLSSEEPFADAIRSGTRESVETFLLNFPGHARTGEAQAILVEIKEDARGQHVVDLLTKGKVEVQTAGDGMSSVNLLVHRVANHPVTLLVPAGTFFRNRGGSQNMICTADVRVELLDDDQTTVEIPAACCNLHRDAPDESSSFRILKTAPNPLLRRLIAATESTGIADGETIQNAVWIITDDAEYEELILTKTEEEWLRGDESDDEGEDALRALQAIQLCVKAGIDIRTRSIWQERDWLMTTVEDLRVKRCLESLERTFAGPDRLSM